MSSYGAATEAHLLFAFKGTCSGRAQRALMFFSVFVVELFAAPSTVETEVFKGFTNPQLIIAILLR